MHGLFCVYLLPDVSCALCACSPGSVQCSTRKLFLLKNIAKVIYISKYDLIKIVVNRKLQKIAKKIDKKNLARFHLDF